MRAIDDQKRLKEEMEEKEKKQLKKQLKLTQMQSDLKELEDELEQRKQEALMAQKKYQEAQAITREKDDAYNKHVMNLRYIASLLKAEQEEEYRNREKQLAEEVEQARLSVKYKDAKSVEDRLAAMKVSDYTIAAK